ncbi:gliding motility lipoprotein GldD [uncultured Roseivirga sp.]|uniref:gliding motility lipoprotein GldD n=1 Tax=uncultured Roseivirga sp. TaxID=543088 RepID=UPI00258685DD|nr:gliding motility lipoprotein GldD [uncultured Roseivirga sp.]
MRKTFNLIFASTIILGAILSCEEVYLPKPKGFNRIDLPEPRYQILPDTFPYNFQYSDHSVLTRDDSKNAERYWVNLIYPQFDAIVQITYKSLVDPRNQPQVLLNEAFELAMKHNVKAYGIEESLIKIPNGQVASVTELEGEVPTQFQFFTSDSTHHFFRGALYFNTATKNDSLAPVIEYIKTDMIHLLNSFEWKY